MSRPVSLIGAIDAPVAAALDPSGALEVVGATEPLGLTWWVGADDEWRDPSADPSCMHDSLDGTVVWQTSVRVPSGFLRHRCYGTATGIVAEIENESSVPCAIALVVSGAGMAAAGTGMFTSAGGVAVVTSHPVRFGASAHSREALWDIVAGGHAREDWVPDASASFHALLLPVTHRTKVRVVLADAARATAVVPAEMPAWDEVARGWLRHLERGAQVELGVPVLDQWLRRARAELLLLADPQRPARPEVFAALEQWGFDDEAAAVWSALRGRDRRAARRRAAFDAAGRDRWRAIREGYDLAPFASRAAAVADWLRLVRDALIDDRGDEVALLGDLPAERLGVAVRAEQVPVRAGAVSFALRWHGARPALLWDVPPAVAVTAPALDAGFRGAGGSGEALLAAPPSELMALAQVRDEEALAGGTGLDQEPESFS